MESTYDHKSNSEDENSFFCSFNIESCMYLRLNVNNHMPDKPKPKEEEK